jgi:putative transposase
MPYSTDLTDSDWEVITSILPDHRQRKHSRRQCFNAIFYVLKSGCPWRMLPESFPPWQTVYYHYRQWRDCGVLEELHAALRVRVRRAAGREDSPSVGIADAQSVKTASSGSDRGFDGGKRVKGRKRHIIVDTLGLVMGVTITAANVQDKRGLPLLLEQVRDRFERVRCIYVDQGYRSQPLCQWVKRRLGCHLEVVQRQLPVSGFAVLPKRWIVERTFSWWNNYRRLSKDYERSIDSSQAMVYLAMIRLMLNRLQ